MRYKREAATSGFILSFPPLLERGGRTGKSRVFQEEVTNRLCNCYLSLSTLSSQHQHVLLPLIIESKLQKANGSNPPWPIYPPCPMWSITRSVAIEIVLFLWVSRMRNIFFALQETTSWNLTSENSPKEAVIRCTVIYAKRKQAAT